MTALLKYELACFWYLITRGMWRGECRLAINDDYGVQIALAAARGSIEGHNLTMTRVFHQPKHDYVREHLERINGRNK